MEPDAELRRWQRETPGSDPDRLRAWWSLWRAAEAGDETAAAELSAAVALAARVDGEAGRPPSAVLQPWLRLPGVDPEARGRRDDLLRVAADAHAVGAAAARDRRHRRHSARAAPVVALGPRIVVGFVTGQPDGSALDVIIDRIFKRAIATRAAIAAIDVTGVEVVDDVLRRTLAGTRDAGLPSALRVVVCGHAEALSEVGVETAVDLAALLADEDA